MAKYNKKCSDCGKSFPHEEMTKSFKGGMKCRECISIKKIKANNQVLIPAFLLRKYNLEIGDTIKLFPHEEGILIKKYSPKKEKPDPEEEKYY